MADIKSFPNNRDEFIGAEWVMRWLHGRTSGVFGADKNAAVSAVPGQMAVAVSDGIGWISNSSGNGVVWWNDKEASDGAPLTLSIEMADSVRPRIDRVIVSWPTIDYTDLPKFEVLTGVPDSQPTAPTLINDNLVRQISLSSIRVPPGATEITADMITDERLDKSVCGIVTEQISVDTSVMQAQYMALLAEIETELNDLNTGTATMLKAVYDTNGDGRVDRADEATMANEAANGLWRYAATLAVDGWSGSDADGYTQTVSCTQMDGGPAITAGTVLGTVEIVASNNMETNKHMAAQANYINTGICTPGAGTVTCRCAKKPDCDLPLSWLARNIV